MSTVVAIAASPFAGSVSDALLSVVSNRIGHSGSTVIGLTLRELPARPLLAADRADPHIAGAISALESADGVVIASPAAAAVHSGLLQVFLDLLPECALSGKSVLPLVTGPSPAQQLVLDHTLRPVLIGLGAQAGAGRFVLDAHLRAYPDGGVVLAAESALPVAEVTDAFLSAMARQAPVTPLPRATGRVSPIAGAPDLTVVHAQPTDPVLAPLLRDLKIEYSTRYGGPSPHTTLTEVPASDFTAPAGAFVALTEDGETVAGGAVRRYDERTAEVKRVWTSSRHRRRGLARRLMAELERAATELGYHRIHLTTGPRQPEAVALYLAAGYQPRFDPTAERVDGGPLAFGKELTPGAGLVDWAQPTADEYYREGDALDRLPAGVSAE